MISAPARTRSLVIITALRGSRSAVTPPTSTKAINPTLNAPATSDRATGPPPSSIT